MGRSLRGLLDTSVLIADDVAPLPGALAISAVSLAELHFGVLVPTLSQEQRGARLSRLSRVQRRFDALPVDEAVAETYGRLAAVVVGSGRRPRRRGFDLLIAATAVVHDATLYTRNPSDLAGLEDLVAIEAV